MATRRVAAAEIVLAQIDGWSRRLEGAEHLCVRELGDGRAVYLRDMSFGNLNIGIGKVGCGGLDDVWCFQPEQALEAWSAALGWDGQGEPEGWYRHYRTGRRRPGGDASKEFIHW